MWKVKMHLLKNIIFKKHALPMWTVVFAFAFSGCGLQIRPLGIKRGKVTTLVAPLVLGPSEFSYPAGRDLAQSFRAYGGVGGYRYSVVSGGGSIHSSTGEFISPAGERTVGGTTVIRVVDADGRSQNSTITHLPFSTMDGVVNSLATDGSSIYMSGSFTGINPEAVRGILVVNESSGQITNRGFLGKLNGEVYASVTAGDALYLGGNFSLYGAVPVQNLIKVDSRTGALDSIFSQSLGPDNVVSALAVSGDALYIGGMFTSYRGDAKGFHLAKLSTLTGDLDLNFNSIPSSGPNGTVNALALYEHSLYVAGNFTSYRSDAKGYYLAKVDQSTGALDTIFNTTASSGPNAMVKALIATNDFLYLGGDFTTYRGDTKGSRLVRVDTTTGALDTVNFNTTSSSGPNSSVNALALSGTDLYFAGAFTSYRGDPKGYRVGKVNAVSGALETVAFNTLSSGPNAAVNALFLAGNFLYLAGDFTYYRGDAKGSRLVRVDATNGTLDIAGFNSVANDGPNAVVRTLAAFGTDIYAGGGFTPYRPDRRGAYLVKLDAVTGALDSQFNNGTGPNDKVFTLELHDNDLYAGGAFTSYRGDSRATRLMKLDATTGVMDTTHFNTSADSGPSNNVFGLAYSAGYLYVGGNFGSYRDDHSAAYLVKVNATSGVLEDGVFHASGDNPNSFVYSIKVSGNDLFVGGNFTDYRGSGNVGAYLVKLNATTGVMDATFNSGAAPNSYIRVLGLWNGSLYAGGDFTTYRGDSRGLRIAKIDTTTGQMDTVGFNTIVGGGADSYVYDFAFSGNDLYVAGGFTSYRSDPRGYRLLKLNATTGVMDTTGFNTLPSQGANANLYALALIGADLYVAGALTGYRNNPPVCSGAIAVDAMTATRVRW